MTFRARRNPVRHKHRALLCITVVAKPTRVACPRERAGPLPPSSKAWKGAHPRCLPHLAAFSLSLVFLHVIHGVDAVTMLKKGSYEYM